VTARKTARKEFDFYPTPRSAARVVFDFLARQDIEECPSMLDPAAGDGALIRAGRDWRPEAHWSAIEIDGRHEGVLEEHAEFVQIDNALTCEWPWDTHVVANPPFRELDDFWVKLSEHRVRHATWCAMFHPVAWWSAEKRRHLAVRPDIMLALGWRPKFHPQAGAAHKPMQDFAWSVLAPVAERCTRWERVERSDEVPQLTLLRGGGR
jgi:hypothetical protein